jgi:hypothetical protein
MNADQQRLSDGTPVPRIPPRAFILMLLLFPGIFGYRLYFAGWIGGLVYFLRRSSD